MSETVWTTLGNDHILDFDGFAEFVVPNVGSLQEALSDPYYRNHVQPDEAVFIDAKNSFRTVGWEESYIEGSKIVGQHK